MKKSLWKPRGKDFQLRIIFQLQKFLKPKKVRTPVLKLITRCLGIVNHLEKVGFACLALLRLTGICSCTLLFLQHQRFVGSGGTSRECSPEGRTKIPVAMLINELESTKSGAGSAHDLQNCKIFGGLVLEIPVSNISLSFPPEWPDCPPGNTEDQYFFPFQAHSFHGRSQYSCSP